jgi:hypothetical protein
MAKEQTVSASPTTVSLEEKLASINKFFSPQTCPYAARNRLQLATYTLLGRFAKRG